jgi:hypothetical protein
MSANASLNSVDRESYLVQRIIGQLSAAVAAIKEMGVLSGQRIERRGSRASWRV